ncbi:hypothetical protein CRUP_022484, partial [Coryphaenoides rupestris]
SYSEVLGPARQELTGDDQSPGSSTSLEGPLATGRDYYGPYNGSYNDGAAAGPSDTESLSREILGAAALPLRELPHGRAGAGPGVSAGRENRTQTLPGRWFATLAWARGAAAVQPMEFFFVGVATATEVAYYAYIYSVVPAARYQRVTGYCRSATLLGSAAGSPSGRPPVTVASVPPRRLVYATLASAAVAFAAPWFLPTPGRSLFFHPSGAATAAAEASGRPPVTVASVPPRRLVYATLASTAVAFAAPWFPPTACGGESPSRPVWSDGTKRRELKETYSTTRCERG